MLFSALGAAIGLIIAIVLIIKEFSPVYSLIFGAFIGGILGSFNLSYTISSMINGSSEMIGSVIRILASGILAAALIKTGSAKKIGETILSKFGEERAHLALAMAAMLITASGVFVDITVITLAPVALAIAEKANSDIFSLLLSMTGGGKAGNIISPNPNTIATADSFGISMNSLIYINLIPAIFAFVVTVLLAEQLNKNYRLKKINYERESVSEKSEGINNLNFNISNPDGALKANRDLGELPSTLRAFLGPLFVIFLLSLRQIADIEIDPIFALLLGGLISMILCGKIKNIREYFIYGFSLVTGVCILLLGTGALMGIIKNSDLQNVLISLISSMNIPVFVLAPLSGILLSGATASTTAGSTIASSTFANVLVKAGISPVFGAAMVHAGATVLDHLPHGSFFHATGGACMLTVKDRMKLIPYEVAVGLTSTVISVLMFLILR